MKLVAELKRRNVIRMAGLYMVGAWLITQVAGTVLPMFGAPGWIARTVVILLAIGFIPALAFAWIFELTPEGLKRDAEVAPDESIAPQTARRMERLIIALFAVALVFFALDKFVLAPKREAALVTATERKAKAVAASENKPAVSAKTIAVLPFVDMSKARDQEYFSDGLAETTLDMLSRVPDLKVISRTSSFAFKGKPMDVREIGRKLGVAHILEGSVQQSGDTLRITAQLIRTSDGSHLWSKQYDRRMADIFKIQDEVATEVVNAIQGVLPAADQRRMLGQNTGNVAAYQEYLKGIALLPGRKVQDMLRAVVHFERAIELDPGYARAYAMAAIALGLLGEYTADTPEMIGRRDRYIDRALELSPGLGEAHIAQANRLRGLGDLAGAQKAYQRGIELAPSYSSGYQWYGELLFNEIGEPKQALPMFERALSLDPLSPVVRLTYSNSLANLARLDEASAINDKLLADYPGLPIATRQQAFLYGERGDLVQALRAHDRTIANEPSEPNRIDKCFTLLQFGALAEAKRCAMKIAADHPQSVGQSRLQAALALSQGDFAGALPMLGKMGPDDWTRAEILQSNGRSEEALEIYRKMVPELFVQELVPGTVKYPGDTVAVAAALIKTGASEQAHMLLRAGIKDAAALPIGGSLGRRWSEVFAYGLLGEYDNACKALAEAADAGYFKLYVVLENEPALAPLRARPCFERQYARIRSRAEAQVAAARKAGLL
jgi:TolB-like protein/Tfp pilus assembly protein PilF